MEEGGGISSFVRVLDPSDPWLDHGATAEERADNFRGRRDWDISVAMESRCPPLTVVAVLHGARREVGLSHPAHYRFATDEVESVGGALCDTPAEPPWPDDYNHAHHDIVGQQQAVSERMAALFSEDGDRVRRHPELKVLLRIAELLFREDVHKKFKKHAAYRFTRLFDDGGEERELWISVAEQYPALLELPLVLKELRRMYHDTTRREEWREIMARVEVSEEDRGRYK